MRVLRHEHGARPHDQVQVCWEPEDLHPAASVRSADLPGRMVRLPFPAATVLMVTGPDAQGLPPLLSVRAP